MSRRNKKRKGRESQAQLLTRVERELAKGNAKSALKDVKVAYRNEPTPEARKLLEAAYAGRVEQLHRQNLGSEARAVLQELLDLKPTEPDVRERLPRMQVLVGDNNIDSAAFFEEQPELLRELADKAVVDWACAPPTHVDIPTQVTAVREAFTAVEAGDDARAAVLLNDIPRNSPLGEWKLFLRGLTAFYQGDGDRTTANWRRLDPHRPPYRIARTLQVAAGDIPPTEAADVASKVKRLESRLGSGEGYEHIVSLGESWRGGQWRHFLDDLRRFRQRYGKTHDTILQQIAEIAWRRAIREGDHELFRKLTALLPAPEIDPNWNRARALFAEHSRTGDANAVEDAWKAYARDIQQLSVLRDDERAVAEGLVYLRLGRKFVEFAEHNASPVWNPWAEDEIEDEDLRKPAAQFLRHSIQVCPHLTDAYRELAKLHEESEDLDKAAAVYEKLLKHVPADFDAQLWLARFHLERDEPGKADAYTSAARRLKPRDPQCVALGWTQQLTTVRCLTKKRKLDEAREELKKLYKLRPPDIDSFAIDLIAAAIEFKAKNLEAAHRLVDAAASSLEEPTAVWLQMSSVAARYSLSRDIKKEFDQRYKQAIGRPPTSQTAGLLASYLYSLKCHQVNYTGRATQERLALAYLDRAEGIQWKEGDLAIVCEWLYTLPRQAELFDNLLELGLELFPKSPRLSFLAGANEMRQGPFYCDVEFARACLQAAIKDNEQAALPLSPEQLELARDSLSRLEEMLGDTRRFGADPEFYDDDDDYEDDDYFDDEDDFGPSGMLPPVPSIEELMKIMPPDVKAALEETAAMTGRSVEDLLEQAIGMGSRSERGPKAEPKTRRRGHAPQNNQSHFEFADE